MCKGQKSQKTPLGDLGDQLITFLKGHKSQNSPYKNYETSDQLTGGGGAVPDSPKYESAVAGIGRSVYCKIIGEDCKV